MTGGILMNKYDNKKTVTAMSKEDSYTRFSVGSFFIVVALFFTFFSAGALFKTSNNMSQRLV